MTGENNIPFIARQNSSLVTCPDYFSIHGGMKLMVAAEKNCQSISSSLNYLKLSTGCFLKIGLANTNNLCNMCKVLL